MFLNCQTEGTLKNMVFSVQEKFLKEEKCLYLVGLTWFVLYADSMCRRRELIKPRGGQL